MSPILSAHIVYESQRRPKDSEDTITLLWVANLKAIINICQMWFFSSIYVFHAMVNNTPDYGINFLQFLRNETMQSLSSDQYEIKREVDEGTAEGKLQIIRK